MFWWYWFHFGKDKRPQNRRRANVCVCVSERIYFFVLFCFVGSQEKEKRKKKKNLFVLNFALQIREGFTLCFSVAFERKKIVSKKNCGKNRVEIQKQTNGNKCVVDENSVRGEKRNKNQSQEANKSEQQKHSSMRAAGIWTGGRGRFGRFADT